MKALILCSIQAKQTTSIDGIQGTAWQETEGNDEENNKEKHKNPEGLRRKQAEAK